MANQGSSERRPSLGEILARARKTGQIHTVLPGVVTRYDAAKRRVDVQPTIEDVYLDEEDARQTVAFPVIPNCPIVWPGGGGYVLTFPISDGVTTSVDGAVPPATTGVILISERSLDAWLSGTGGVVDPEIDHDHDLTDGIFLPEMRPFGSSYPSTPTDHAVIGKDGGVQIHLRGSTICIGDESGSDFIARADKVLTELNKISGLFDSILGHKHSFVGTGTVGPPTAGATGSAGTSLYTPSSVAAQEGKVK